MAAEFRHSSFRGLWHNRHIHNLKRESNSQRRQDHTHWTGNGRYDGGGAELLARVCILRDNMKRLILILILAATSTASASTEYLRPTADATTNWRRMFWCWDTKSSVLVNERCLQRQERQWPYRSKRGITWCELLRRLTLFGASVHHLADGPHKKLHYALHAHFGCSRYESIYQD